ncbi:hypothetical protein CVT26_001999 [Gymnopilus dilepis]|uniref:Uncharacterized protein n=1 Tax=Gymnopilus dilepis TaxID=231916 RepID=A0A409VC26_9AGAR|nr:hypothetical protein CVT26_001999 [Gymnopilus dilepis]
MRSFTFAAIALLASSAAAQFTINTPSNVQVCRPVLLQWTGGTPGQPTAPSLVDLGQQTGTSVTWIANLAEGTSAFLDLRDNTGTLAQSGTFTVQAGSNSSCVGQTAVTSAGPSGPAPTGGSSGPSTTQSPANSGSNSATSKTSSSSSGQASPTQSKAAAVAQYAPVGAAAMIGAALLSIVV